jgi:hypothetical protein
MNIPDDPNKHEVPEEAKGNPVYEQTRQDMPLWCCGRNCGRNSRYVTRSLQCVCLETSKAEMAMCLDRSIDWSPGRPMICCCLLFSSHADFSCPHRYVFCCIGFSSAVTFSDVVVVRRSPSVVVLVLGLIGIGCSIFVCLSQNYFTFESLRNDTFYDELKQQPAPFEYATVANVGMFRYEILEVFEYPWPPENQRMLFDELHDREVERLTGKRSHGHRRHRRQQQQQFGNYESSFGFMDMSPPSQQQQDEEESSGWFIGNLIRRLQLGDRFGGAGDNGEGENNDGSNVTNVNGTDVNGTVAPLPGMGGNETNFFDGSNVTNPPGIPPGEIPDVLPGNSAGSSVPTVSPSASPTITNPNDIIAETVDIGVVKAYDEGIGQFDQTFTNGQRGAMLAPIFAGIGLFFSLIELCCCTYKCSWLPTALFLYGAFMFQLMTIFLFMTQEFW